MELITHVGLGALSARTLKARLPWRWSLGAAALGAVFPDSDFVLLLVDPLSFHACWHRSFTHSLVMLPLWGALPGWLLYRLSRRRQPYLLLWLYACLGVASHIALDLLTAWDIALLWPVSDWRTSVGWLFIIDPWFSGLLLVGLVAALRWQPAVWVVWACLALWVVWSAANKQEARERAAEFASTLEVPSRVEAWPQPFSPYHWKLLASTEEGHWQAHVHLGERPSPLATLWPHPWLRAAAGSYRPVDESSWEYHSRFAGPGGDGELARQLWLSNALWGFRSFASHPARYPSDDTPQCIWFTDLLYVLPEQRPPFVYGACRDEQGNWAPARKH